MARFRLWPVTDPGSFRIPVTLLTLTVGTDAMGGTATYAASVPPTIIMADVDTMRGTELIKAGQDITQSIVTVTSWYHPAFTAQCRLQLPDSSQLIIQHVNNVSLMNVKMELTCLRVGS